MLWLFAGPALAQNAAKLQDVGASVAADGGTEVSINLRGAAPEASYFALDEPRRLVIDLKGAVSSGGAFSGAGPILNIRTAQFTPNTVRVVLDLSEPARIAELTTAGGRVTATLERMPSGAFAKLVSAGRKKASSARTAATAAAPAPEKPRRETRIAAAEAGTPAPRARRKPARAVQTGLPIVVIDAGHGGKDPGSPSVLGRSEKDAVLQIAKAIKLELDASGRVRTVLTREDDTYLPHRERTGIARKTGAQLFISVHADSFPKNPEVSGATIYTLSETSSDKEAARLARRENRSDIIAGVDLAAENDDVTSILIDLAQRETMNSSAEFAALLQREMVSAGVPFRSHFHRFAGFLVLKAPDVPAVLLETGYMSNRKDSAYLFSEKGQTEIARGVRRAVEAHFLRKLAQR